MVSVAIWPRLRPQNFKDGQNNKLTKSDEKNGNLIFKGSFGRKKSEVLATLKMTRCGTSAEKEGGAAPLYKKPLLSWWEMMTRYYCTGTWRRLLSFLEKVHLNMFCNKQCFLSACSSFRRIRIQPLRKMQIRI
jgi:hypothetical protein